LQKNIPESDDVWDPNSYRIIADSSIKFLNVIWLSSLGFVQT